MGKAKQFKKQRKYARKEAEKVYDRFSREFNPDDFLRPRPRFVPEFAWNALIRLIIAK